MEVIQKYELSDRECIRSLEKFKDRKSMVTHLSFGEDSSDERF